MACAPLDQVAGAASRAEATGQQRYKHKAGLDKVLNKIKIVYADLYSDDLLMKCLHGKTQNANECFNGMIWQRAPRESYVSLPSVKFTLYDAVSHFNNGNRSTLDILNKAA